MLPAAPGHPPGRFRVGEDPRDRPPQPGRVLVVHDQAVEAVADEIDGPLPADGDGRLAQPTKRRTERAASRSRSPFSQARSGRADWYQLQSIMTCGLRPQGHSPCSQAKRTPLAPPSVTTP